MTSILLVALSGTGGRSQLFCAAMAMRFSNVRALLIAVSLASLANCFIASFGGVIIGQWISQDAVQLFYAISLIFAAGGMLFFQQPVDVLKSWKTGAFLTCFLGLFILQLGDKGQFMLAATAARTQSDLLTMLGGWIGSLLVFVPAILLRDRIADILPLRWIRLAGGCLLLVIGLVIALSAYGLIG